MAEIPLDLEAIANSLEQRLYRDDPIFSLGPAFRLRMSYCGVTSLAIVEYLTNLGYDAKARISTPHVKADPTMQHVVAEVISGSERLFIDPTYSQFLGHVGIGLFSMHLQYYPQERVIAFPVGDVEAPVDRLLESTRIFRDALAKNQAVARAFGARSLKTPEDELRVEWSKIWDESDFKDYIPSEDVADAGMTFGRALTKDLQ